MKRLLSIACLSVAPILVSLAGCQSTDRATSTIIRSAHSSWIEEKFQTEILNIGLEQLGYQPEAPKELEYPALYVAIANGELDYSPVYYEPSHQGFFENAGGADKLTPVGLLVADARAGYQIDRRTAQQHSITDIQQLKDPQLAKLFDSDGDGKANLVGCNPGWACELVIDHHLKIYGLEDTVEHDRGQYATLLGEAIARYQQGQSILFFAYHPHWVSTQLKPGTDVTWLTVPFTDLPGKLSNLTEADTSADGHNYGFIQTQQRAIANQAFLANHPQVQRWFELVKIPADDMNAESLRIKNGEDRPDDIRRHAEAWVQDNQALVDGWLAEAKQAGQ